jgi:hypothetical protein
VTGEKEEVNQCRFAVPKRRRAGHVTLRTCQVQLSLELEAQLPFLAYELVFWVLTSITLDIDRSCWVYEDLIMNLDKADHGLDVLLTFEGDTLLQLYYCCLNLQTYLRSSLQGLDKYYCPSRLKFCVLVRIRNEVGGS